MNKVVTPILAIAAAAGVGFGVMQMSALSAANAKVAELDARLAALQASLNEALAKANSGGDELDTLRANVARLTKERDDAKAAAVSSAGIAQVPDGNPQDPKKKREADLRTAIGGFLQQAMDDPEQRSAMKSMSERMIAGAYDKLFKKAGINEADAKLVTELLNDRNFAALEKGRKLLEGGKPDDAAIATTRKEVDALKADYDAKVRGVIGEDKFRELATYEQTVQDERSLDFFARNFQQKGHPLEQAQRDKLTEIMREERLRYPRNEIPDVGGGPGNTGLLTEAEQQQRMNEEKLIDQAVINRAAEAGLNPDQAATLRDSLKQRADFRTMGNSFQRALLRPK